jgi:hypothetical protein
MQIINNKIKTDILLLFFYIIISPIIFSGLYSGGYGGLMGVLLFSDVLIITVLTTIITIIIYLFLNYYFKKKWISLSKIIIPISCSNLILINTFPKSLGSYNQIFSETFLVSNNLSLAIIFILNLLIIFLYRNENSTINRA